MIYKLYLIYAIVFKTSQVRKKFSVGLSDHKFPNILHPKVLKYPNLFKTCPHDNFLLAGRTSLSVMESDSTEDLLVS